MDELDHKNDGRFDYFKERIALTFPKLAGPKIDKIFGSDDIW
jgi:hypothetical protein